MAVYVADLRSTTGWTERWATGEGSFATTSDGFRITKTGATNLYAVTWDIIDGDANRDAVEILAKVRFTTQAAAANSIGVVGRASGATGAENLVKTHLRDAGNDGADQFRAEEYVNGTQLGHYSESVSRSNVANRWYWIRARANGTDFKTRLWEDGSTEPAVWTMEGTVSVVAAGWVGIYAFDTPTDPYDIGYFAVATNGDVVSTGASGGFFLGADF